MIGKPLDVEHRSQPSAVEDSRSRPLAAMPVMERRVQLAGVSTAVLEGGNGPPVVLLHGPNANVTHWIRVIPGLVTTHRVLAPALPGQGASKEAGGPLDAERVLAWLGELIEHTCPSPAALVGNTLGLTPFAPAPELGRALQEFLAQPTERTHDGRWRYCALDMDGLREERWEPINFQTSDEDDERVRASYGANFDRLVEIKGKNDPDNVFRSNRNIRPRAGGGAR